MPGNVCVARNLWVEAEGDDASPEWQVIRVATFNERSEEFENAPINVGREQSGITAEFQVVAPVKKNSDMTRCRNS